MNKHLRSIVLIILAVIAVFIIVERFVAPSEGETHLDYGAFYQKLDFKQVGGKLEQNWVVLQNGTARIGLFQGMFDKNILTFNPGWTKDKETLTDFQDVRELQRALKARGLTMAPEADMTTQGPAFFEVTDPDGNTLLFDQHVPSPKR